MRYTGELVSDSRRDTNNSDYTDVSGIPTKDFVRFLNYAQSRIFSLILNEHPNTYSFEKEISIIAGQQDYSIPDNVHLGERISLVEYSLTGLSQDYHRLPEQGILMKRNYPNDRPASYLRRNGLISLQPPPTSSQGKIRVTYERGMDSLDIRRGKISASTVSGGGVLSALTLDTSSVLSIDQNDLIAAEYLCVNDRNGNPLAYNIPVNGYNTGTGVVTLVGTPTLQSGESVPVGAYVTIGKYTTTHSKLNNICERYLIEYCNQVIFSKDAATASKASSLARRLLDIEAEIIASYQVPDKDAKEIQITNSSLILEGD